MTEKEYREYPAISRSQLWRLRESPEKFRYYEDHPQKPSSELIFGQMAHKLLLEPETFSEEFAVMPPGIDRRTKAGKAAYQEFQELVGDRTIISSDDYQTAQDMVEKCLSYPEINELLIGEHEKPYFWEEEETGEPCKCRVDSIGNRTIVDYKTTSCASDEAFAASIERYGYNFQAAMYLYGARADADKFVFIAQEKTPPFSVNIVPVGEYMRTYGLEIYRSLIHTYHYCRTTGDWYGYLGKKETPKPEVLEKLPWE